MRSTGQIIYTIPGSFHIFMRERDNNTHHNVSCASFHIHNSPKYAKDIHLSSLLFVVFDF